MPLYNFKLEFARAVQMRIKRCTIRLQRKRSTKAGDTLYLYVGLRTRYCRKLLECTCTRVQPFYIDEDGKCFLSERLISGQELDTLAKGDGFLGPAGFVEFFRQTYGLPLQNAELISWD